VRAAGAPGTAAGGYRVAPLPPGHTRRPPAAESWGQRVETAAKAIHQEQNRGAKWALAASYIQDEYLRLATAALHADARPTGGETESEPLCGDCDYPCGPDGCSCPDECPAVKSEGRSR
jgi:hypothetical protein